MPPRLRRKRSGADVRKVRCYRFGVAFVARGQMKAESVDPPNNNGYERTLRWTSISKAVEALTPFASKSAAEKAGFDTSKAYKFEPFTPTLPEPLGEFHSFLG